MTSQRCKAPVYPVAELQRARLDFKLRWSVAEKRDPVIRNISEWHRRFPPNVRILNCLEYPFTFDESVYQMPRPADWPKPLPSKRPKLNYTPNLLLKQCADITEALLYSQSDGGVTFDLQEQSNLFICDNCSFSSSTRSIAQEHLKAKHHTSCSRFVRGKRELDGELDAKQACLLSEPRAVYNGAVPGLAWLSEKHTVVCPTCFIIFPDKLMCSYHHQSQHHQLCPNYSFGNVLSVRQLTMHSDFTCDTCKQAFSSQSEFANHWTPTGDCPSPFELVLADSGQPSAILIMQAYCHICRDRFERSGSQPYQPTIPTSSVPAIPGKKRKFDQSVHSHSTKVGSSDVDSHWASGFGRFVLNHLVLHLRSSPERRTSGQMHVRVVQLFRGSIFTMPPFQRKFDSELLLFCIHECKRLVTYLGGLRGVKRKLYKNTKRKLYELMEEANLLQTR